MENFAVLIAVPSISVIPNVLGVKAGMHRFNLTLMLVRVSAVAANVHLKEQKRDFLSRGELFYRADIFDRPWNLPVKPYLAGFPEGADGFCDHCHLHRRYCSIGQRAPSLVAISDSSDAKSFPIEHQNEVNSPDPRSLANGHCTPIVSNNGATVLDSPPEAFRGSIGGIHDEQVMVLYGTLSARAQRSVRPRRSLSNPSLTPGSPVAPGRFISRRISVRRGESSSLSCPPGFSCSRSTQSTPVHAQNPQYSPISVLRIHEQLESPPNNGLQVDGEQMRGASLEEEDPDEDPAEEVMALLEQENGIEENADNAVAVNAQLPFPAVGLQLFEGLDDTELIQMIRDSGFVVPQDSDTQEDIVSRLRQLDRP